MIELWGRKNAYNVQKICWMLDELGLEFAHRDVGSNAGDLETVEFKRLNPHARIPVLVDQGSVIWESNTILRYLAASYGKPRFWQTSPLQRSYVERWMDWELTKLQEDFISLFWNYYRKPARDRNAGVIEQAQSRCRDHFILLDAHLENNNYLAGELFSIADICCGTCLYRYFEMGLSVEKPVNVMAWYERLLQRPAFQNNIQVAFDELKARVEF